MSIPCLVFYSQVYVNVLALSNEEWGVSSHIENHNPILLEKLMQDWDTAACGFCLKIIKGILQDLLTRSAMNFQKL